MAAGEDMEMDVEDGLAGVAVGVEDHTKSAVGKPTLSHDGCSATNHLAQKIIVAVAEIVQRRDVRFRNHEDVKWRLRIDIFEGEEMAVFENDFGRNLFRDDLAEEAIGHAVLRITAVRGMS